MAKIIEFKCGFCGRTVRDYASTRKQTKTGFHFCSDRCRQQGIRSHLSLVHGGDGILRSKSTKDALYYANTCDRIRERAETYYRENREHILSQKRNMYRALKEEVMRAYGGKCECCGETTIEFLTIDHVNGGGNEHRRRVGKGRDIYADIKSHGFPSDIYRILCFNCNITRGFYGYCPHHPEDRQSFAGIPVNPGRKRKVAP